MAVSVGPYTTRVECDRELPAALSRAVDKYKQTCLGPGAQGRVRLPLSYVQEHVVKDTYEEWHDYSVGRMVKLHALMEFTPETKARIVEAWKQAVIQERIWVLGAAALGVLLVLATAYSYLKIDLATRGKYRGRLRLAAATALVALAAAGVICVS